MQLEAWHSARNAYLLAKQNYDFWVDIQEAVWKPELYQVQYKARLERTRELLE